MAKTIQVFVSTGAEDMNQAHNFVQGSGDQGKPTRIKAVKGARYQVKDPAAKDVGPEYLRSKRVGKNLHVSLYGMVENGQIYEYIPESPKTSGLSANHRRWRTPHQPSAGRLTCRGNF